MDSRRGQIPLKLLSEHSRFPSHFAISTFPPGRPLEVTLTPSQRTPLPEGPEQVLAYGVLFTLAPRPWQLISADERGFGAVALEGVWRRPATAGLLGRSGCLVELRLCHADSGLPVQPDLDWFPAATEADGTWSAELKAIPCGGPYRLESRLNPKGNKTREWAWRGDQVSWLLVGDAYVIAGQSNASGYGAPPYPDGPEWGIHLFGMDGQWKCATHPLHDGTHGRYPEAVQPFVPGHSGFLQFAKVLRRHTNRPIALIPCALGGSALRAWGPEGELFKTMVRRVQDAGVTPKAVLFVQGESDAKGADSESYGHRFELALAAWRSGFGLPNLQVFTAQLGRYYSKNPREDDSAWSQVREAQRKAAETLPGCHVLPALDLPLSDTIHYSTSGNLILGERLAHLVRQVLYAHSIEAKAPNLKSATLSHAQKIELVFEPVGDRLDGFEPGNHPFLVEDEKGSVPITRVVYPMNASIELQLHRPILGHAYVSAGFGENPSTLPVDVDRRMPILAFYRFPVSVSQA